MIRNTLKTSRKFQSTLPVGEATHTLRVREGPIGISIHASRGGSDCAADEQQNMALVEQIATLKADKKRAEKALELACRYHRFDDFKTVRSEIEFFAQQAQEQEAEK